MERSHVDCWPENPAPIRIVPDSSWIEPATFDFRKNTWEENTKLGSSSDESAFKDKSFDLLQTVSKEASADAGSGCRFRPDVENVYLFREPNLNAQRMRLLLLPEEEEQEAEDEDEETEVDASNPASGEVCSTSYRDRSDRQCRVKCYDFRAPYCIDNEEDSLMKQIGPGRHVCVNHLAYDTRLTTAISSSCCNRLTGGDVANRSSEKIAQFTPGRRRRQQQRALARLFRLARCCCCGIDDGSRNSDFSATAEDCSLAGVSLPSAARTYSASGRSLQTLSAVSREVDVTPSSSSAAAASTAPSNADNLRLWTTKDGTRRPNERQKRICLYLLCVLIGIVVSVLGVLVGFTIINPMTSNSDKNVKDETVKRRLKSGSVDSHAHAQQSMSSDYVTIVSSVEKSIEDATGWVFYARGSANGSKYKVFDRAMTYSAAQEQCKKFDGYLARINTIREQVFLEDFLQRQLEETEGSWSSGIGFWIGARRARGSHGDTCMFDQWKWVDAYGRAHGTISGFTAFIPGKPDNYYSPEECLFISYQDRDQPERFLKWDDAPCDLNSLGGIKVLCEVEISASPTPSTGIINN